VTREKIAELRALTLPGPFRRDRACILKRDLIDLLDCVERKTGSAQGDRLAIAPEPQTRKFLLED
jgi:hypothetical protein